MHLLETDASPDVSQCYMDSPIVRKTDEKSSMIKASYRPHNTTFSSVSTSFPMVRGLSKSQVPSQRSPVDHLLVRENGRTISEQHRFREVPTSPLRSSKDYRRRGKSIRRNGEQIYDANGFSHAVKNVETNLNGVINGFIVQASHDAGTNTADSRYVPHQNLAYGNNPSDRSSIKVENACVNENSNNNRIPPSDVFITKEGVGSSETESEDRKKETPLASHTSERLEYRRPGYSDEIDDDASLNGSDILKRMYASFGTPYGSANRLLRASLEYNPGFVQQSIQSSSIESQPSSLKKVTGKRKCHGSPENNINSSTSRNGLTKTGSTRCSLHPNSVSGLTPSKCTTKELKEYDHGCRKQVSPDRRHQDSSRLTTQIGKESNAKTDSDTSSGYSHPSHFADTKSPLCKNRSKRLSPSHSIHSLLSEGRDAVNERSEEQDNERNAKQTSVNYHHNAKRESSGGNIDNKIYTRRGPSDHEGSPKRPRVRDSEEEYNEKSREIFRRDKETIENSLRQNYAGLSHEQSAQSPPWLNASAMVTLQANLLSSFPPNGVGTLGDPGMFMKSASIAAAASANPLLLGVNPCFVNPYLLRGLAGGEVAAAAAYHQAMAQGLLQNHPALNPLLNTGVGGNHGVYSGLSPLAYGGIAFTESSPIAAAIAESVRHNAASFYPNARVSYPILPPQMDEGIMPESDPLKPAVSSPSCSPHNERAIYSAAMEVETSPSKYSRKSDDIKTESGGLAMEDSTRRTSEDALHTPVIHHPFDDQYRVPKPSAKIRRSTSPHIRKRKLPCSQPNDSYTLPKKKLCSSKLDSNCKKMSKEFSAAAAINRPKIKNGVRVEVSHLSVNKPQGVTEKVSSVRPSSYKNLTRERRLVANARERTRVHTISSAFEELRHQIPSYSCNQKLSKLAILRIACSYIQSLSVLSGRSTEGTFKESVDQCTRVLQAESRARSRRKSNKAQIDWEVANYEKGTGYEAEGGRKTDGSTPSPEASPAAAHSPSREGIAQVHDESEYPEPDDSRSCDLETSGNIPHRVNIARSDDFNDSGNQSHENVIEDIEMTAGNSLDTSGEQIKRSPVNNADGGVWNNHPQFSLGDNVEGRYTRRSGGEDRSETPVDLTQTVTLPTGGGDLESCHETNPDDQQSDLINVED